MQVRLVHQSIPTKVTKPLGIVGAKTFNRLDIIANQKKSIKARIEQKLSAAGIRHPTQKQTNNHNLTVYLSIHVHTA